MPLEPVLVVLAEKNDLVLIQDIPDLDDALVWVQANTTLEGTFGELTATFPATIPATIVDADYTDQLAHDVGGRRITRGQHGDDMANGQ